MKTYRTSILRPVAFLMLLCSTCIVSRSATACLNGASGPSSFTAAAGGSQSLTWTAYGFSGSDVVTVTVTAGSDVFTVSQMPVVIPASGTATFTVTFKPGANATGTFKGTLACPCGETYEIVGTVAASGVANPLPGNVSFTITPNPATNYVNIISSGVRTAEIGIYDLLGKEITSSANTGGSDNTASKNSTWKWDASNVPTGSYIVRITGESTSGEPFVLSRRIIISR